ncbi:Aspartyl protease [Natronincola peptidivorans]|uniref:Aspartyl protease n=1 Tax=Natronincola peptidivorans TaxID=426128 RepID=A0A1I0H3P9_9FIRM|nr:aspartyl protease family protein [Natronincola peptidivorans]SET77456.1 Aspartyl protease [Natronincola peptidivorans]
MKKYIVVLIILISIVLGGCNKELEWNEFTWVDYSFGNQHIYKAAIFIPFKFNGADERYYVQLDTGATTFLNGNSFKDIKANYEILAKQNQQPSVIAMDGILANYEFQHKYFGIRQDYGPTLEQLEKAEYKKIGNLGLSFFKERILIINFPEERFAIVKGEEDIPEYIKENSTFLDIDIRNNKLFLDVKIGDRNLTLAYDTGASFFDVVTTETVWTHLIESEENQADKIIQGPSFDNMAQLKGTSAANDLQIGGLTIEKPTVYYEDSGLMNLNFEEYPYEIDGIIGNALFYDDYILTIDLINNKFGIMEVDIEG